MAARRAARVDVVSASEKTGSRLRIAKLKRRFAGADQRIEILGVGSKRAHVSRKRRRRRFIEGLIAALCSSRRGETGAKCAGAGRHQPCETQYSPHHPFPMRD